MKIYKVGAGILIGSFLISQFTVFASGLKSDEDIVLFPVSANKDNDGNWNIPIHHWVFEKEQGDITRKITTKIFSEIFEGLGVSEQEANSDLFKQRLMWFLVDNQEKKRVKISINSKNKKLSLTGANGHSHTSLKLPSNSAKESQWLSFQTVKTRKNKNNYTVDIQFIPENGLTVISDIDDTIKISNVLDKKALIKNTFVKPYQITDGFPEYYKKLESQGAYFHYVSASPWQLYPSLKSFMQENYPKGTFSLRNFRIKDSSIIKFLQPSTDYKTKQITNIIQRYPKHQFILIGDSGEHDPEVYANIYKTFPDNIKSIQIREVIGSDLTTKRFKKTFAKVPKTIWQTFSKPVK